MFQPDSISASVIIPARNEGPWVARTVEAVLASGDGRPLEVIVVDDGSTDGSCGSLLDLYGGRDVRLVQAEGTGLQRARNLGATHARHELLVFIDAHVLPDAGWLGEIAGILADPTVGLAGVAVRSFENPASVGYTYLFRDENLGIGWAGPALDTPYEAPCISGCCMGTRAETFRDVGGFDPGGVRWGIEEIELSLRTWFLGYRCVVSPRSQVAHHFKQGHERGFSISWEDYDVNLLRCVLTYFSAPRAKAILAGIRQRESFERSLERVLRCQEFWGRRAELAARFLRDDDWYFGRFAGEFAPFERRLDEIRTKEGDAMTIANERVVCPSCGAVNVGGHRKCLLCQASLAAPPAATAAVLPVPSPAPAAPPVSAAAPVSAGLVCNNCGASLAANVRFCTACGAPAAPSAAAAPPAFCSECGAKLSPGQRFCTECGAKAGN